jgi:hypothetical protein
MQVGDATFTANASYTVSLDRDETTRTITVDSGEVTLNLNGYTLSSLAGTTIANGATLSAAGTIGGGISNAGTLAPGTSPGALTLDGPLSSTGQIEFELNGTGAGQFDQLLVGDFSAGGFLKVILGYTPAVGDTFDIMDFETFTDNGYAFDLSEAMLGSNMQWDTSAFQSMGEISVAAFVPEPSTVSLCVISALVLIKRRQRRPNLHPGSSGLVAHEINRNRKLRAIFNALDVSYE